MYKIFILLILLIFLPALSFTERAFAERVTPASNVESFITVRDAAQNGAELSRLLKGEFAQLLATHDGAYQVVLDNGVIGYVASNWAKLVADIPTLRPLTGELAIHFIDVGQGDSTLLICPDKSSILIDAGSSNGVDPLQVLDYLTEALGPGNRIIDTLIITHADPAHFNLLPDLLRDFAIGHTYHVGSAEDYNSPVFNEWMSALPAENVTLLNENYFDRPGSPNPDIKCAGADIYILAANIRTGTLWRNTRSIVLKVEIDDFSAILSSDATKDTETLIMSRYDSNFLKIDLLKIGNHGSIATSSSEPWISTVRPFIAVVSAEQDNEQGYPRSAVLDLIAQHTLSQEGFEHSITSSRSVRFEHTWETNPNSQELIYSTADSGNILIRSTGEDADISTKFHYEL